MDEWVVSAIWMDSEGVQWTAEASVTIVGDEERHTARLYRDGIAVSFLSGVTGKDTEK